MSYFIKKKEYVNFRPQWLKNMLFNSFTPSLLDSCPTMEAAEMNLEQIYKSMHSSLYLKSRSTLERQEHGFTVLSKSGNPVLEFKIMQD